MLAAFKAFRYTVFGFFVACNAIIASVAVWNMSLVQIIDWKLSSTQIDVYVIFLGCSGLALILPVIFFELFEKNVILGRIWFECTWTALYGAMELAGAIALTVVAHNQLCEPFGHERFTLSSACTSTQVLQAFTWLSALLLLCYFVLLFCAAMVKSKQDPTIWHCNARKFQWLHGRRALSSAPTSPTLPKFRRTAPVIVAPKPRRPTAGAPVYSYRSGLGLEYEIEHYQPPATRVDKPMPPIPSASAPGRTSQPAQSTPQHMISNLFYPDYMQRTLQPQPPQRTQPSGIRPLPASPPPLGDWPRLDATARPSRSKERPPRQQRPPQQQGPPQQQRPSQQGPPSNSLPRTRPTGPRRRSNSPDRPPPLDLSNISAYHTRGYS